MKNFFVSLPRKQWRFLCETKDFASSSPIGLVNSCLHGCEDDKLLRYINPFYVIHDFDMSFGFPFNWNSTKEGYVYWFILAELWQYKYKTTK